VPERASPGGGAPAKAPPFRPTQAMQQMGSGTPGGVQPPLPFGLQQQQQQRQQLLVQQQFALQQQQQQLMMQQFALQQQQQQLMMQQQVCYCFVDIFLLMITLILCSCHQHAGFVGYVFQAIQRTAMLSAVSIVKWLP